MKTIVINRIEENDVQTLGELNLKDQNNKTIFTCKSLELPDKNNRQKVSRIPSGEYLAARHVSPKFGKTIWLQNVPNRSEILIHAGNFFDDTLGCILVGERFIDIDGDGHKDVTNSKDTLNKLLSLIEKDLLTVHINNFF